eukprot:992370-Rhodomonas_salina.2
MVPASTPEPRALEMRARHHCLGPQCPLLIDKLELRPAARAPRAHVAAPGTIAPVLSTGLRLAHP